MNLAAPSRVRLLFAAPALLRWLHANAKAITPDRVGGGWTIETRRGFFSYPTLLQTAWEARKAQ